MPGDWEYNTYLSSKVTEINRRVLDTSSDVAQVKAVSQLLKDMPEVSGPDAHHTAIVLADENLLIPVLSSLPEYIDSINITMGYPLKFSPVYSLVKDLLSLQKNSRTDRGQILFDHKDVMNIIKHNYFIRDDKNSVSTIISDIIGEKNIWIASERFKDTEPFKRIFIKPETPVLLSGYLKEILDVQESDDYHKK
jgi:hypothetical protein